MDIIISNQELRGIITGRITYRKCPACDKNGLEYWDENGRGVSPVPNPAWGENYCEGACEECGGLAYIQNA